MLNSSLCTLFSLRFAFPLVQSRILWPFTFIVTFIPCAHSFVNLPSWFFLFQLSVAPISCDAPGMSPHDCQPSLSPYNVRYTFFIHTFLWFWLKEKSKTPLARSQFGLSQFFPTYDLKNSVSISQYNFMLSGFHKSCMLFSQPKSLWHFCKAQFFLVYKIQPQ